MNILHINNKRGALYLSQGRRMGYPACDIYGFLLSGWFDRRSILSGNEARLLLCNLIRLPPHTVLTACKCWWMCTTRWNQGPIMKLSTLMALCKGNLPVIDVFHQTTHHPHPQYKKCSALIFILILFWISCRISSQISDYLSRHDSCHIIAFHCCSLYRDYRNELFHIWSFICQIVVFALLGYKAQWTLWYVQSILHIDVFIHQLYQV